METSLQGHGTDKGSLPGPASRKLQNSCPENSDVAIGRHTSDDDAFSRYQNLPKPRPFKRALWKVPDKDPRNQGDRDKCG